MYNIHSDSSLSISKWLNKTYRERYIRANYQYSLLIDKIDYILHLREFNILSNGKLIIRIYLFITDINQNR